MVVTLDQGVLCVGFLPDDIHLDDVMFMISQHTNQPVSFNERESVLYPWMLYNIGV